MIRRLIVSEVDKSYERPRERTGAVILLVGNTYTILETHLVLQITLQTGQLLNGRYEKHCHSCKMNHVRGSNCSFRDADKIQTSLRDRRHAVEIRETRPKIWHLGGHLIAMPGVVRVIISTRGLHTSRARINERRPYINGAKFAP